MKVIKKGRPQAGWAAEIVCTGWGNKGGGCGALLLVEKDDLFKTYRNSRDETETFTTFRCPECGIWTDLNGVSLPFKVRERDSGCDGDESGQTRVDADSYSPGAYQATQFNR